MEAHKKELLWDYVCGVEGVQGTQSRGAYVNLDAEQRPQCPRWSCWQGPLSEPCKVAAAGWCVAVLESGLDLTFRHS